MRDPDGSLTVGTNQVTRIVDQSSSALGFLKTKTARELVDDGYLIPFDFISQNGVVSRKIEFVSYPSEWCDSQFTDAASFTIDLSRRLLANGFELKDASAWNVLFSGNRPIFCDHLSFARITTKQWWAMGQFARHFILPLLLSSRRRLFAHNAFRLNRDGLYPQSARNLLGIFWPFSRCGPLMFHQGSGLGESMTELTQGRAPYHEFLYKYCEWCLPRTTNRAASNWVRYSDDRNHYTLGDEQLKKQTIYSWLERVQPEWVMDLGCNTGEFVGLAQRLGASVIAVDADHDAINCLFRTSFKGIGKVYPVIANLANLNEGTGWLGHESVPLVSRLANAAELVLCLAVAHHLICSEGIPFPEVAAMLNSFSRDYVILENISSHDPMVEKLMKQRNRKNDYLASSVQKDILRRYFSVVDSRVINSTRELLLLKKLNPTGAEIA